MSGLGDIFKSPKMPTAADKPVTRMPDTEDPTVVEAGRRRVREERARGGRESTDLSGSAPAYGGKDLGL